MKNETTLAQPPTAAAKPAIASKVNWTAIGGAVLQALDMLAGTNLIPQPWGLMAQAALTAYFRTYRSGTPISGVIKVKQSES